MSQMILQREPGRHLGDEVALALGPHRGDEVVGDLLDVVLDGAHHAGVEGGRHDPAQPGMAGVVHVDHRPEELEELGGHVEDGGARLARAEQLGVPADLDHVGVTGDGVVARARGDGDDRLHLDLGVLEEGDGALGAQRGEGRLTHRPRLLPELEVRQIDVVDPKCRSGWSRRAPSSRRRRHAGRRPSPSSRPVGAPPTRRPEARAVRRGPGSVHDDTSTPRLLPGRDRPERTVAPRRGGGVGVLVRCTGPSRSWPVPPGRSGRHRRRRWPRS